MLEEEDRRDEYSYPMGFKQPSLKFKVFIINLFTSLPWMNTLQHKDMAGVGTVLGGKHRKYSLTVPEVLTKQPQGSMDHRVDIFSNTVIVSME